MTETISPDSQDLDTLLGEVTAEYFDRLGRGERPSVSEYAERYPAIAELIRRALPALDALKDSTNEDDEPHHRNGVTLQPDIGGFRILRELGRGGMGVVYEAEQESMGRRVAVKVLPFAALADERMLARFKNEVRAAATLDHPGIVSVFSVGEEHGVHYYVMQLVRGHSLAEAIGQLRRSGREKRSSSGIEHERSSRAEEPTTPLLHSPSSAPGYFTPPSLHSPTSALTVPIAELSTEYASDPRRYFRRVAELGAQIADALQHAHEQGIVHRDIKPGNLLIDAYGKPYVTDFGLARIATDVGVTMTGDLVGTLRYMSPEQALGKQVTVDHRADIYSLGATLYELLTLQPVFRGENREELLRQLAFNEPTMLRRINAQIPAELETIVLKALRKDPAERYASARALADDLRCFLEHKPIKAKPPTILNRTTKWSQRHVEVLWMALAASLIGVAVLATSAVLIAQSRDDATKQKTIATQEKDNAINQRDVAKLNQYHAEVVSGQTDLDQGNVARLHQKLIRHLPLDDDADRRGWEWYYLFSYCHPEVRTLHHRATNVFAAWSPDGEYIAAAGAIWKAETGECIRLFTPARTLFQDVAWSTDSQQLAWGHSAQDNAAHIWNRKADTMRAFRADQGSVWCVAFSPDGQQLATGAGQKVKIWGVKKGSVVRTLEASGDACGLAWSADGELLAAGEVNGLTIWNVTTGDVLLRRSDPGRARVRVAWRPDSSQLAVNTGAKWYILDRQNFDVKFEHEYPFNEPSAFQSMPDVKWNSAGTRLAIAHGNVVTIWDPTAGQPVDELRGHIDRVNSIAWSPDGNRLVTSDGRQELRIWDLQRLSQPPTISTGGSLQRLSWADGDTLVSIAAADLSSSFWNATTGKQTKSETIARQNGDDPGILSPDRRLVARLSHSDDGHSITVQDASTGAVHSIWRADDSFEPLDASWSPDGSRLAITIGSSTHAGLECWDVHSERTISRWVRHKGNYGPGDEILPEDVVRFPTWSPDGAHVAVTGWGDNGDNGTWFLGDHLHVIDVASGTRVFKRSLLNQARSGGQITALRWSPDSHDLALASSEGMIDLVDIAAKKGVMSCKAHDVPIEMLDWSPDGRRLATAAADGLLKIIEVDRGNELLTLRVERAASHVDWSPDGERLAAATEDGTIHVWDASRGYEFAEEGVRSGELAWAYYRMANEDTAVSASALRKTLSLAPPSLDFRWLRGHAFARLKQYDAAAREFAAAIPAETELGLWMVTYRAYALLGARDLEAYRDLHARLVKSVANSDISPDLLLLELGSLVPGAIHGFEGNAQLIREPRAKIDSEGNVATDSVGDLYYGAILYRQTKYQDAVDILSNLLGRMSSATDQENQYLRTCAEYFLAMARHHLGHEVQARRLLEQAREADNVLRSDPNLHWSRRVALDTLRREATGLIEP